MPNELLPPSWRLVRLGDREIGRTTSGGTPDRSNTAFFAGKIRWVKSGELKDRRIRETEEKITEEALGRSSARLFPVGTLLIAMYGATVGKTGILAVEAATNQAVCAIFPSDNSFLTEFLQYQLIFLRPALLNARSGGAQPNINQRILNNLQIVLPPLPEQRSIARILRAVQAAKEARECELALEREHKAALMEHLFTHGTRGEPTKFSEIGEMPESWEVVELGQVCNEDLGLIQTGPFGSQLHASDYKESGIPVVNPTHMGHNVIIEERLPFISRENADRLSKHYLMEGDILLARRGDFSHYSYVSEHHSGWLCGTGCILIRLHNSQVDNYFLSVWIGTEIAQSYLTQYSVGMIMPNLNTKILQGLPMLLPPVEEQHQIARALQAFDAKIAALEEESHTLNELFQAMLEELMTGRFSAASVIEVDSA